MATVYEVSITTFWGTAGVPDPNQVYAILKSGGTSVNWPETLTSISFPNIGPVTSITTITKALYETKINPSVTGTGTFGQYHVNGNAQPWPATFIGDITITPSSTATTESKPSSTQITATPLTSVTSGETTTTAAKTEITMSKSPTSTSKATPAASPSSKGISAGATAGIAIGCALVGLVIGLIAAFCLFKRKRKRSKTMDNAAAMHDELEVYPSGKGALINDMQLSQFLLEPTPDRVIAQETQSIGALIDQHVESYYHHHPIEGDQRAPASALADLGFPFTSAASLGAQGAAALCLDPRSRQAGLRHVIMRALFSSIDVHSSEGPSMLPAPVASFLRAIPPHESDRLGDPQANVLALRKWRELSAFLLHPARSQRTPLPSGDAMVEAQAREMAKSLNTFLRCFVDKQYQQQQVDHLQAVIEECAKLGSMLFSHPCDWAFIFEPDAVGGGVVVVEPGLRKVANRDMAATASLGAFSQVLVGPVMVTI